MKLILISNSGNIEILDWGNNSFRFYDMDNLEVKVNSYLQDKRGNTPEAITYQTKIYRYTGIMIKKKVAIFEEEIN